MGASFKLASPQFYGLASSRSQVKQLELLILSVNYVLIIAIMSTNPMTTTGGNHLPQTHGRTHGKKKSTARLSTLLERFLATKTARNTRSTYRHDLSVFLKLVERRINRAEKKSDLTSSGSVSKPSPNSSEMGILAYPTFTRITPATIATIIRSYLDDAKKTEPQRGYVLNPATINRKISALSSFFDFLVTWYGYPKNPMVHFERCRVHQKSTTDTLTAEEVSRLLHHLESMIYEQASFLTFRNFIIFRLLYRYALRRSELVSLRWEHFHPQKGWFSVIQKGNDPIIKPLRDDDWEILQRFRLIQDEHINPWVKPYRNRKHAENLFPFLFHAVRPNRRTGRFEPLTPSSVYKLVCGIAGKLFPEKHITPHSFRGSFVGAALNQKIEPGEIANGTGHKSIRMVYYYDKRDPLENNAIAKLDHSTA